MKILNTNLRAIVERVTSIEYDLDLKRRLFIFEHLDNKGVAYDQWIRNWEGDDVTNLVPIAQRKEIFNALEDHYKSKSNSSE